LPKCEARQAFRRARYETQSAKGQLHRAGDKGGKIRARDRESEWRRARGTSVMLEEQLRTTPRVTGGVAALRVYSREGRGQFPLFRSA
jgi:hypothetical protein